MLLKLSFWDESFLSGFWPWVKFPTAIFCHFLYKEYLGSLSLPYRLGLASRYPFGLDYHQSLPIRKRWSLVYVREKMCVCARVCTWMLVNIQPSVYFTLSFMILITINLFIYLSVNIKCLLCICHYLSRRIKCESLLIHTWFLLSWSWPVERNKVVFALKPWITRAGKYMIFLNAKLTSKGPEV